TIASMLSTKSLSMRLPIVYRCVFGNRSWMRRHNWYAFFIFSNTGKTRWGGGLHRIFFMKFIHTFGEVISVENLLAAWKEFVKGKRRRHDVQEFQLRLMEHILTLHECLCNRTYRHDSYRHFKIYEPKERDIHKATVRDRLLHRALYRILYPFFDQEFIYDSYSCRVGKGTHLALNRFYSFASWLGENGKRTCYILKCDIRKFFANIDHAILLNIQARSIPDTDILRLLKEIINSFNSETTGKGLPLGNLTSQLFVNIYMNEFDQFVKDELKVKYYIRYADDFVIFSQNKDFLYSIISLLSRFLSEKLRLALHPDKISIATLASGVDFLGWVHFPNHRVLRTATRRRMLKRVNEHNFFSYVGLCKHGNTFALQKRILASYSSTHART
ncbi:MAG: hypothetical protein G01um101417_372, partial [Parcubacteria group bacterium Gr01-1014_17]